MIKTNTNTLLFISAKFLYTLLISVLFFAALFTFSEFKVAKANISNQIMNIGISNDVSWDNSNIGGTNNSKLLAGPWVLDGWKDHHTQWLNRFKAQGNENKTPYLYTYVIAGKARQDWGLQDCNVSSSNNLCDRGSEYLRQNYENVSNEYQALANNILNIFGSQREILIHLEPDFYQYGQPDKPQQGGPLTQSQAHQAMNSWTSTIKSILPNAKLVMDVSPWNYDLAGWSQGFSNFDYAGMVGKRFDPYGDGSVAAGIDGKTYQQMSQMTGKKLILNDAHGPGGYFMNYNYNWDNDDIISQRFNDGVIAVLLPPNDLQNTSNLIDRLDNTTQIDETNLNMRLFLQGALLNADGSYNTTMRGEAFKYSQDYDSRFIDSAILEVKNNQNNLILSKKIYLDSQGYAYQEGDFSSNIKLEIPFGEYKINILHRNHLNIGIQNSLNIQGGLINIDLSNQDLTINQNLIRLPNQLLALKMGDVDDNTSVINSADRNLVIGSESRVFVYSNHDVNLDGLVNSSDRNTVIGVNSSIAFIN